MVHLGVQLSYLIFICTWKSLSLWPLVLFTDADDEDVEDEGDFSVLICRSATTKDRKGKTKYRDNILTPPPPPPPGLVLELTAIINFVRRANYWNREVCYTTKYQIEFDNWQTSFIYTLQNYFHQEKLRRITL